MVINIFFLRTATHFTKSKYFLTQQLWNVRYSIPTPLLWEINLDHCFAFLWWVGSVFCVLKIWTVRSLRVATREFCGSWKVWIVKLPVAMTVHGGFGCYRPIKSYRFLNLKWNKQLQIENWMNPKIWLSYAPNSPYDVPSMMQLVLDLRST